MALLELEKQPQQLVKQIEEKQRLQGKEQRRRKPRRKVIL